MSNDVDKNFENLTIANQDSEFEAFGYKDNKNVTKKKAKTITFKMIIDRNLNIKPEEKNSLKPNEESEENVSKEPALSDVGASIEDEAFIKAKKLLKLTHIHLDRENIEEIDNLAEYLGEVTHLYLQYNLIKKIENLDFLVNIKFLILSNNQIEKIENLTCLKRLKLLDLSYNLIDKIDIYELPKSLSFLDLRENECFKSQSWYANNYEEKLLNYLVELKQLNGEDFFDEAEALRPTHDYEKEFDNIDLIKKGIVDRSELRQKNDVLDFDKLWAQKKAKLDILQKSLNENFNSFKK